MEYKNNYNKNIESVLKLNKLYVKEASIKREEIIDNNLQISIDHSIKELNKDSYKIEVSININNNSLNIKVIMIGLFESINKDLIETNAIAIMFPYIRSYISTLTTQPDMVPIVLQPINVLNLMEKD